MHRRLLSTLLILALAVSSFVTGPDRTASAAQRPNILWITCEDISPHLGCYGDPAAVTPNLDRLAERSVRYTRAYAAASVCSPARSCLITGVWPNSLGTIHLRSRLPLPEEIHCFPEYLRGAGFYCTNNVKEDYQFKTPPGVWDESSRQAHWRGRKAGQPFFSVFNLTCTHQSQIRLSEGDFATRTARLTAEQRHDPATIPLPPYYPDTPVVRRDVARLHDLITAMDIQVGDLLRDLADDGLADDTIVFFFSDHGDGLPRHKRWLHDSGTRVPMLVYFPEKYAAPAPTRPGTTCDQLVSFVDFAPTVLSLLGLEIPEFVQGRPFLGPASSAPREYTFALRDRVDEVYEMSRMVTDGRFHYIRNYLPHRPSMQFSTYSEQTPTRSELRRLLAEDALQGPAAAFMSPTKPAEELYDTQTDPNHIHNLVDQPQQAETLARLRRELRAWMVERRDLGLIQEAEIYSRCNGTTPYEMARAEDRFPVERLLEAAELVGRGVEQRDRLVALLDDDDSGVRRWAVIGLMCLGDEALPVVDKVTALLDDKSPSVRLAAAEAVCRLGRPAESLAVLAEGLRHDDGWVRLDAAIRLNALGPRCRPVLEQIKAAAGEKGSHSSSQLFLWALARAIRQAEL